jgi:hypothetical protein
MYLESTDKTPQSHIMVKKKEKTRKNTKVKKHAIMTLNSWNRKLFFPHMKNVIFHEISVYHSGEYEDGFFWVVDPCSLVEVYRRFRGVYCLHHQGDRDSHL